MGLRFRRDDARPLRPGEVRSGSVLSRIVRDTRAAAAVEFALVAAPFLFLAYQVLDTATADASRLIRTGQAQQASYTAAQFKTQVCNRLYLLFDCSGVYVESVVYSNFGSIPNLTSYTAYVDTNGNFDPTKVAGYNPGVGSDIVVVRVFYAYPVMFKNLLWDETSAPGGKILMTGVAVFRNEPFPWT